MAEKFSSHNPATGELLWEGIAANETDVDNAVKSAKIAFEKWATTPLETRIQFIKQFSHELSQSKSILSEAISKETGKPLWESKGEVDSMINKVTISIDAQQKRCAEISFAQQTMTSITRFKPHGVVTVFGPFNFPGHLPNGHIVPALLAGNTVIFKPSELTPLVAELTNDSWKKCGMPKGVLNLVQGGRSTGQFLANHPSIDGLFFTGSWQTGKILSEQFAKTPQKILALEMGGNNPLIVFDVADQKTAAYLTIQSAYLTAGQRCTCARRLIIAQNIQGDTFLEELIHLIHHIKVGPYTDNPEPFMGSLIQESTAIRLLEIQKALKLKGGIPLVEMKQIKSGTGFLSPGLMDVSSVVDREDEELFGPFLQVIRVPNFDAAIKEANNTTYGMSAGLLSDRSDYYKQFYQTIKAGVINWNTPLTGASSHAPFGGVGRSGNHRPSAYYATDYCNIPIASLTSEKLKMPEKLPPGIPLS